jgi:dihydroorotate dehydrogenase electron transfer subunit
LHGNVIDLVNNLAASHFVKPDVVFSCGPDAMLKAVSEHFKKLDRVYLSLEKRMACGIGACYGCVVHPSDDPTGQESLTVCHDGPVFNSNEVIL